MAGKEGRRIPCEQNPPVQRNHLTTWKESIDSACHQVAVSLQRAHLGLDRKTAGFPGEAEQAGGKGQLGQSCKRSNETAAVGKMGRRVHKSKQ